MLIVCPSCASEYTIDPDKLGADGRTVRCAICRDTWFVSQEGVTSGVTSGVISPSVSSPAIPGDPKASEEPPASEPAPLRSPSRPRLRPALAFAAVVVLSVGGWTAWERSALSGLPLGERVAQARGLLLERLAPPGAGLGFRHLRADLTGEDGTPVLTIAGEIVNGAGREFELPHLEILVRSGDDKVLTTWTDAPPRPTLGPGEAVRFSMRFPSPPPDARQVRVQFTTVGGIAVAVHSPKF